MSDFSASALATLFASPLSQRNRLLGLEWPQDDIPDIVDLHGHKSKVQLVVERLEAEEAMSRDFCFTVHLLGNSARLALKDMLGKLLAVTLVRPDGALRYFTGHVFEFALVKADDGIAHYRAVLRPWLHYLTLRANNRVFLDQNLHAQTQTILNDYGTLPKWQWRVNSEDLQVTMAVQGGGVGETDANYLHARWEALGLSYCYEHTKDGHELVLRSDFTQCLSIDGAGSAIRFHTAGGSAEENSIKTWASTRPITSAEYAATSWNFKAPQPVNAATGTVNRQGEVLRLQQHEYAGAYGTRATGSQAYVELRAQELDALAKHHDAESNSYHVQPGRWFELTEHFTSKGSASPDSQYLILEARHTAQNNYLQQKDQTAEYTNTFTASRRSVPWRPGRGFNSTRVQALAPQTAVVVGAEGAGSVDVDEYGRIRVRFHWDRESRHTARIRVASNWAGGDNGLAAWPRKDTEVVVQCLDGNPDHPVITGCLFNQTHMPPWQLPEQKVLTGLRSRELTGESGNSPGGGSNHVLLDDTPGQLQVKLRSDTHASELTLGHNVRIDSTAGRTDQRATGAELRTDGHGAIRAAKGLLVTTEARPNAQAHMTDMDETVARLKQGRDQHEHLSDAAQRAGAHKAGDQDAVTRILKEQNDAIKGSGSDKAHGHFPELSEPHLVLASPAGIQTTTAGSTHLASDAHNALTSGAHTSVSTGKSFLVSSKEAVRIAAFEQGIRMVAAAADIDITALKNCINVIARLDIKMEANRITITAKEEILINGGTSYTRWNAAGIVSGTNAIFQVHSSVLSHVGPDNKPGPKLPEPFTLTELVKKQSLAFTLRSHASDGRVFASEPYALYKDGAKVEDGVTDMNGQLIIQDHQKGTARYTVKLANGHDIELPVKDKIKGADDTLAGQGFRAAQGEVKDRERHQQHGEGEPS